MIGRSTLGAIRRRLGRARSSAISLASPRGTIDTDLAPGHPLLPSLPAARAYNAARSAEAGKAIRDGNRIVNFHIALDLVAKLPAGDYAELGTYRGMTASVIWPRMAAGSTLYCFDTFEGFDQRDLGDDRLAQPLEKSAFRDTSLDIVRARISNGNDAGLAFRVGFFPDTFAGLEQKRFRFVHIDMDLADPIRSALAMFWPRMVDGGIILVHDYRSKRYPMAAEAVDEFFAQRGIVAWPLNDRLGTAMIMRHPNMPD
ncbi:class I SAM-dependent methyltransferase [Sphingomonas prati]|uniref:Putative O-methyltransferase YrrM n=1 Tax=Sphingomonas prati TaxID=1843237 RepID=A0A7W9BR91_9SPHN|nr:class I SAM-dependent methyltransferase [Sphingomonas prati]MBB5728677.1 putative O-methyltransferase YrrM [Sphingomonas prati]GGE71950.1 methyltransferase MtfD [Sphingomonas prati]